MTSYDLDPVSGKGQYYVKYRRFQQKNSLENRIFEQKQLQIMCFELKIGGEMGDEKDDSSSKHSLDNVKMFISAQSTYFESP